MEAAAGFSVSSAPGEVAAVPAGAVLGGFDAAAVAAGLDESYSLDALKLRGLKSFSSTRIACGHIFMFRIPRAFFIFTP